VSNRIQQSILDIKTIKVKLFGRPGIEEDVGSEGGTQNFSFFMHRTDEQIQWFTNKLLLFSENLWGLGQIKNVGPLYITDIAR